MLDDKWIGEDVEGLEDGISVGSIGRMGNGTDYLFLQDVYFIYICLGSATSNCCTVVEVGVEEGMV